MAKHRFLWITIAVLWLVISTILLCLPGSAFPESSWTDYIPFFDKWVHIGMFAILTFLLCMAASAWGYSSARTFAILALLSFAYGVLMEFVQHYWIPFRSFDVWDMVADGAGAALGFMVIRMMLRRGGKV